MIRAGKTQEQVEEYKNGLGNLNKRIYSNEFGAKEIEVKAANVQKGAEKALRESKKVNFSQLITFLINNSISQFP